MEIEVPVLERDRTPENADPMEGGPALHAFGTFLKAFAGAIAGQLCASVDAAEAKAFRQTCEAALRRGAAEGHMRALAIEPGRERGCLVLGRRFAGWTAEVLLGAPPVFAGQPRDFLTDLDRRSIDSLLDIVPALLNHAFGAYSMTFRCSEAEVGPSSATGDDARVLVLTAVLRFGDSSSTLTLILPERLAAGPQPTVAVEEDRQQSQSRLLDALAMAVVDVEAVLKGSDMPLGDLLRLRPGMVLALPHKAGTLIDCQVNGVTKFTGEMTRSAAGPGLLIQSMTSANSCGTTSSRTA